MKSSKKQKKTLVLSESLTEAFRSSVEKAKSDSKALNDANDAKNISSSSKKTATGSNRATSDNKRKPTALIKEIAIWFCESDARSEKNLLEKGFPSAREIYILEEKARIITEKYNDITKIKNAFFGSDGLQINLNKLVELTNADDLPDIFRHDTEDLKTLPLHSAFNNTILTVIKRDAAKAIEIGNDLERILNTMPCKPSDIDKEMLNPIKKNLKEKLIKKCKTGEIERELNNIYQRKVTAQDTYERFSPYVSDQMAENAVRLCRDLEGLLESDECKATSSFCPPIDEDEETKKKRESLNFDPCSYAYWRKCREFSAKIKAFIDKYTEEDFSTTLVK